MIGFLPLVKDFITRLQSDGLLGEIMGAAPVVYTERPSRSATEPFLTLDLISTDTSRATQSYDNTAYLMQVSAWFARSERGSARGVKRLGETMSRVRQLLADVDGFALNDAPTPEAVVRLDFQVNSYVVTGKSARLILRQYVSGQPITDPDGHYIQGVARFRCLVGTE